MKKISFGITINITLLLLVIRNMMISFLFKKMQFASAIIKLFKVIIIIIIFKYIIFTRDVWNARSIDRGKLTWKKPRLKLNFYVDDNNTAMCFFFIHLCSKCEFWLLPLIKYIYIYNVIVIYVIKILQKKTSNTVYFELFLLNY